MFPDEDNCAASPCQNGATCVDEHGGYTCQCTNPFIGNDCTGIKIILITRTIFICNLPSINYDIGF